MTTNPTEWGTTRQAWFANVATPSTKIPVLLRDDSYSVVDAGGGRSYRMGDPITTGPAGVWHQRTWEGGTDQDNWSDEEMFYAGPVDPTLKPGKVQLWPGWVEMVSRTVRLCGRYITMTGQAGYGENSPVLIAESKNHTGLLDPTTGTTAPTGGYKLMQYANGTLTNLNDWSSPIMAMTDIEQENGSAQQEKTLVGLEDGRILRYNSATTNWVNEHTMKHDKVNSHAMCTYAGGVYIGTKWQLSKRTHDPDNGAKYSQVAKMPWLTTIENFVVWNNRIWFTGRTTGGTCHLLVSDGVTVTEAFEMTGAFKCTRMVVHYGSLYLLGMRNNQPGGTQTTSEVWRYNGSSLTKVWEEDPYTDATEPLELWDGCSWRQYLVWGRTGSPSLGRLPGLMLYDAELDAVIEGPVIDMYTAGWTTEAVPSGICVWNNTLVMGLLDKTASYSGGTAQYANGVFYLRKGKRRDSAITGFNARSMGPTVTTISRKLYSSQYDAGLPAQDKVWLNAKIRCKIPQYTQLVLKAVLDDSGTESTVSTITYNGSAGWRNVSVPFKISGDYVTSTRLQYVLQLENTSLSGSNTATPEVDSVSVEWVPKPLVRSQFRIRVLASDSQTLLDGTANTLTTAEAITNAIGAMYAAGKPVLFWPPASDGTTPVASGQEVQIAEATTTSYRLNTEDTSVNTELALTLTAVG